MAAARSSPGAEEFEIRQSRALSAKRRIARNLRPLVAGHDSMAIDASTTLFQAVENLSAVDQLVVVTYGIPALQALPLGRRPRLPVRR